MNKHMNILEEKKILHKTLANPAICVHTLVLAKLKTNRIQEYNFQPTLIKWEYFQV